jgi:hypothetical protein
VRRYQELDTKYNEQLRQNQITIHIKDLETREKIKELTEKVALESDREHQRYDQLQQQKVEAEMEFNERLKTEEVHLSALLRRLKAPQYWDLASLQDEACLLPAQLHGSASQESAMCRTRSSSSWQPLMLSTRQRS